MQELLEKITQEFEIFKIDSNLQVEKGIRQPEQEREKLL